MTAMQITSVLYLVAALQLKHFICDGPLQTAAMVEQKSIYGAWLGIVHSAFHGIGTLIVFLVVGSPALLALSLAALDFMVHYHIDFTKENIIKYFRWGVQDSQFWWALSADQAFHQFTYLALTALALKA